MARFTFRNLRLMKTQKRTRRRSIRPRPAPIRFHQSAGEVHFHDDKAKAQGRRAHVAEWHVAMKTIRNLRKWSYLDVRNKTLITARPYVKDEDEQVDEVEVFVEIKAVAARAVPCKPWPSSPKR